MIKSESESLLVSLAVKWGLGELSEARDWAGCDDGPGTACESCPVIACDDDPAAPDTTCDDGSACDDGAACDDGSACDEAIGCAAVGGMRPGGDFDLCFNRTKANPCCFRL